MRKVLMVCDIDSWFASDLSELSKTAEGRVLALEGPLWELIKRRWEHRGFRWIFHRAGLPIRDFRKAWLTACKKTGINRIFMTSDAQQSVT